MNSTRVWLLAVGGWLLAVSIVCGDYLASKLTVDRRLGSTVIPTTFTAGTVTVTSLGGAGTVLAQANNSGTFASAGISATQATQRGYFGDGSDGTCTFDGTATPACATKNSSTSYTVNRDCLCAAISTVASTVTVHQNGWRMLSAGLATINGIIDNSGSNGAAGTGSGTAAGGASGVSNSIGGSSQLGAGGAAAAVGGSIAATGLGGAGGGGGTGGQTGGTVSFTATGFSYRQLPEAITTLVPAVAIPPASSMAIRPLQGGAGGGGGSNTSNCGGGGGGGGGVLVDWFESWAGTGTVQANGGNGANACTGGSPGGGGGGGYISAGGTNISSWGGTFGAVGGSAGTGGSGGAGAGASGTVVTISS